eukprot:gene4212-14325_t
MAPEVFRQQTYNEKADVYGYAILMYEILHRFMMIKATDGSFEECQAYARRVSEGMYRPPINPKMPPPLKHLIEGCWNQAPSKRPSMCEVVARLLECQSTIDLASLDRALQKQGGKGESSSEGGCCAVS